MLYWAEMYRNLACVSGVGAGMSVTAAFTATMRQFRGHYVATVYGGLSTSTNGIPLLLTLIYDIFFLKDGSYEHQDIQGYFLFLAIATIISHMMGVAVFGLPTVEESDYEPFQNTNDANNPNGNDFNINDIDERKPVTDDSTTYRTSGCPDSTAPNYSPTQMLKSPHYAPVVFASGILLCLKYISLNNLNTMLVSFGLPQYEASLPFLSPASAIILRPIFGVLADWTQAYFSRAWYLYLSVCMHLVSFIISFFKADNIYVFSAALIMWTFASDTANTIGSAVITDDFGLAVFSVNVGIHMTIFAVLASALQCVVGVMYETHVPDGGTSCVGLICFRETFVMGIGASVFSMLLITIYFYFRNKSVK